MNRQIFNRHKKLLLVSGALFLGWAAHAQTTGNDLPADSTHQRPMHHRWNNRSAAPDSLISHHYNRAESFRANRFDRDDQADRFAPQRRFDRADRYTRNRRFARRHHNFIHYTPEQRQQAMAINKDFRQKREDLFRQDNITLKQYKDALLALEKDRKAKMQALLTPQQKSAMAAHRKQREDNAQVRAAARLERLRLNLDLSDDQVARLRAGGEDFRSKARAIHENDNLLPQEKRAQLKVLMASRKDNLKSILTPVQLNKFQLMGHHRFGGPWQGHGNYSGRTT